MAPTSVNPNSSNFFEIKTMFEGLTTKKPSEKAFEGLQSVTNTTEPKAQLPSPKATSTEGKKRPPAVPEKTAKTKKEYDRLKQKHEANLLSKSVTPRLQKPVLPRATSTEGEKIPHRYQKKQEKQSKNTKS
ncbi:hypothetical protein BJP43_01775 [Candidatus Williamhamiltonella defendens]|uniref:Uncharacterized protein n=2 Tax=Candidatus Williamhamiltonella defendens TaxID=138072 RepID=A0A2D3TCG0_9ENTR|nr:hypothetical protein BJP43_01775 [Candidatus Hamiltonella defensa]